MRRQRGIRTRLLIVVVAAVALALALMTLGFNVLLARSLSRDADALLRSRAATEAASVDVVEGSRRNAGPAGHRRAREPGLGLSQRPRLWSGRT